MARKSPNAAPQTPAARESTDIAPRLVIEYWPIERLKPYERNPRKNDGDPVDKMVDSIQEYGFSIPVLARSENGQICDGHLRFKAAQKIGMTEVPVIPCDGWSDAQFKAFRLLANRSVSWAAFDMDLLSLELADLKLADFDLTLTGFDAREIDKFTLAANPAEDEVPPVPVTPVSRIGDLWVMEQHRLLAGDSTNAEDVARLMDGDKADLVFTDPPYSVNFGEANHNPRAKRWAKIKNDNIGASAFHEFIVAVFTNVIAHAVPACPVYCWSASMAADYDMLNGLIDAGLHVQSQIVWVKNCIVLGQADYQWKHEPCWYGWTPGKNHYWAGGRALSTVWEFSKDANSAYQHPMQKPVALSRHGIDNSCPSGGIVLDLFGGSGSTLAGCESTKRVARTMEMEPGYVDVIVLRWQKLTGNVARLDGDGRSFDEVAKDRLEVQEPVTA